MFLGVMKDNKMVWFEVTHSMWHMHSGPHGGHHEPHDHITWSVGRR